MGNYKYTDTRFALSTTLYVQTMTGYNLFIKYRQHEYTFCGYSHVGDSGNGFNPLIHDSYTRNEELRAESRSEISFHDNYSCKLRLNAIQKMTLSRSTQYIDSETQSQSS